MSPRHVQAREWPDRFEFRAEVTDGTIRLVSSWDGDGSASGGATRGVIQCWSAKSRARLTYRLGTLAIGAQFTGVCEMVTLTYPSEFPLSGRVVKRHLAAWRRRMERRYGDRRAVWKLEFQRRGAPHVHVLYDRPEGEDWREFAEEVREMWFQVVGSGDDLHRRFGANVDRQWLHGSKYGEKAAAWYFAKRHAKNYQSDVPAEFADVGRLWGVWRMRAEVDVVPMTHDEFVSVRRMVCKLRGSRGFFASSRTDARLQGCWTLAEHGTADLLRMLRCVRGEYESPRDRRVLP